ncbi:MAG TPA: DNA polymerase IV [Nitrospirota bacterium]|nr:DNA polymerase IV [Nitrospirota bacterium]
MRMKTILHIDMNAFFASVEQRANPALRGKAMAVIGSKQRGVVLSPSYEARGYGVKTGMTYGEALRACPDLILIPANSAKYSHTCDALIKIWKNYTPLVEMFSIDEAFLDVSGCEALFGDAVQIAIQIKERTWIELGLTCSIGIAPNKLLAKLGSDMQKPDGLVLIASEDVAHVLEDIPVKEICGIGPNLTQQLATIGIRTCGELGRAPINLLSAKFGIIGERLRNMGLGLDHDPVMPLKSQEAEKAKSMGHSMTLDKDCSDKAMIERHILQLSEQVGRRLRRGKYSGQTVSLTLRYSDFHTVAKQKRLQYAISHGLDIHATAVTLLHEVEFVLPVRLVGISVSGLERNAAQVSLFAKERKRTYLVEAMDDINNQHGDFTVTWGTLAQRNQHERIISPAWRPEGDRQY